MKTITLAALLLSTFPLVAQANPAEWLRCGTGGDALGSMELAINGIPDKTDTVLMHLTGLGEDDAAAPAYPAYRTDAPKGVAQILRKKGALSLTFTSEKSVEFGGAVSEAAFLTLKRSTVQRYEGVLAQGGYVYKIYCQPAIN